MTKGNSAGRPTGNLPRRAVGYRRAEASVLDDALRACLAEILTSDDDDTASRIIALPTAKNPRALLPSAPRRASSHIVRRHFGGGGPRRAMETAAVAMMVSIGAASKLPVWQFEKLPFSVDKQFHSWVRASLDRPHYVGLVLIGPRRANRKPVVMLTDGNGDLVAVVKVGYNPVTQPLVRAEAAALRQVAGILAGQIHVPGFIAACEAGQRALLLMEPLPALEKVRQRVSRGTLLEIVRAVASAVPGGEASLTNSLEHPRLAPLRSAGRHIAARLAGVSRGSAHGDLHAGNLGIATDGRPVLWDWERWSLGLPVGFDLLHYDLQSWINDDGLDPGAAARQLVHSAPAILAPLGVSAKTSSDVARDYLVRLAARYVADAQDEAGSRLGAVEDWIFPAVLKNQEE